TSATQVVAPDQRCSDEEEEEGSGDERKDGRPTHREERERAGRRDQARDEQNVMRKEPPHQTGKPRKRSSSRRIRTRASSRARGCSRDESAGSRTVAAAPTAPGVGARHGDRCGRDVVLPVVLALRPADLRDAGGGPRSSWARAAFSGALLLATGLWSPTGTSRCSP